MRNASLFILGAVLMNASVAAEKVSIEFDAKVPQMAFAADEIRTALTKTGHEAVSQGGGWRIAFAPVDAKFGVQAYHVSVSPERVVQISGGDANGLMYGGLEVAEAIRLGGGPAGIAAADGKPHVERRGIKFNIPLDARTPSYSDASDSAQQNIPEMWSRDFWHTFLDEMARHRFNVLTLWSLHPFPSMVKVPEFPDVALNDVMRTTVKFDSTYSLMGHDMVRAEHLKNLETVKKITIDEKIVFWREIMQYAHDRGIDVYVFTWNIFTFGADGKYGITHEQNNPKTIAYFRASVREMVRTYPLLAGIGITSGERMSDRKDEFAKEKWLWKSYGEGLRDALKDQPNRPFHLIHRYHQSALKPIMDEWKDCPGTFDLSYKYAIAHMYSHPAPEFAKKSLEELPPNLRMWMTVRNDDIYSFRWGDADFARDFVRALPGPDKLAGYYMGPDGYTWGREFLSTEPDEPRALVMQNQWFSFMLWGRLSYNPTLPNAFFEKVLSQHFPGTDAVKLSRAMAEAGKIIPQVSRFYWQDIDLKWFPEACTSHPKHRGFHTVKHFVEGQSMPGAGVMSIREFVKRTVKKDALDGQTPPQVVEALRTHANAALKLVAECVADVPSGGTRVADVPSARISDIPSVRADGDVRNTKELRLTLGDQQAMALLGLYYAEKIAGATELGFFDATGEAQRQSSAVQHLEKALDHWKAYAAVATKQYRPQLLTRVGQVDLNALTAKVAEDIEIAKAWRKK